MTMKRRRSRFEAGSHRAAPDQPPDPYQLGLAMLARRDYSTARVRERLRETMADEEAVEAAIERLTQEAALDDHRLAAGYARTAAQVKGRGRLRILRELAQMGIPDAIARDAVEQAVPAHEQEQALRRAIARHVKGPLRDDRSVRRAYAALIRLGFPPADVRAALLGRDARPWPDDPDA